ncbi:helix-turn-helix transcriptional regulator [Paraburkholderia monticola]|uniref:Helix-turn-helix transcriptional regulator n=1 Tax=Paraburkholderia monticola TaxID=1399968 RepID=A0A149PD45_9BURK|nr:LuxR C-terminal-related transcriptional regulator [Paraburkholderia monticola]KXU82949.1 helix-turn-helix transcriptional regulator [Paraburkholderia monticola]
MQFTKLLIETRFAPPRIGAHHVARTDLLDALAQVRQRALALITGGAGYGKTTLLAQWRQRCLQDHAKVAWLSLTSDDKGFGDFCLVLFAALQKLGVAVDLDVPVEQASAASVDEAASALLAALARQTGELYLILDDYHHVEDPGAHRLVQRLVERCTPNLHLLIASRVTPPLSLGRLRVMDRLVEIGSAQLPFLSPETRSFLEGNLGIGNVSADDTSLVHELTGGWPSCLQLIVIMLRNRPGARTRLRDLVCRSNDLQTWLSEEVIATLPPDLVALAETLSIFRRFNAPLAAFVSGNPAAPALLARMERENLPLQHVELDEHVSWFRFHRLFAEFLITRVERRGAAALAELHRRASHWFAQNDLLAEAVRHANLAGDVTLAAQFIERAAPATWTLSYLAPALNLLERLPRETLFERPRLAQLACLAIALRLRPARAEAGLAQLGVVEGTARASLVRSLPLVRAVIALQRDDTQRTIDLLESHDADIAGNPFLRYLRLSALTMAYAGAGRHADARKLLETEPIPEADRNNDMMLMAQSTVALSLLLEGDAREAAALASSLYARALHTFGQHSACANVCSAFLADAHYELNRIDDARETLANRHGLLESSGMEVTVLASLCRARLDLLQEDAETALAFLRQQAARFRSLGYERPLALMLAEQVRIHVRNGHSAAAEALLQSLDALAKSHADSRGFLAEIPIAAALAHARVALGSDPARALLALEEARRRALAIGRGRLLTLVDLLAARALASLGRAEDAMASRSRAVQYGCRYGLVRTFLDEGTLARDELALLVQAQPLQGPALAFAQDLLSTWPRVAEAESAALPRQDSGARSAKTALTQREIEILSLVAQAMPNKRIALALSITVETVKWNLRNVFAKLGVSRRYDAMVWARTQKLID